MPKRTNDFQFLIKMIYDQIVPEGGKITESGMVFDKDAEILREVDILVEYKYAGHSFSFMVECRDRSRKESVEWIDALIGKSKSLCVDKVIAVSSQGFASSAIAKAKKYGIETLTLEKAQDTDWTGFPIKPGILVVTDDTYQIQDVFYQQDGEYLPITTLGIHKEIEVNGEIVGELHQLIEFFFQHHIVPQINDYKKEHFSELFRTKADVAKTLLIENEYTWRGIFLVCSDDHKMEISKVKFIIAGNRKSLDVKQSHHIFNNKMVSTGSHLDPDGTAIEFCVVQDPETEKVHLRWQKRPD